MPKLKKSHFYYGAILDAIFQYNEDASPALILNDEDTRQAYKILTNTSRQECIVFFKYASQPKAFNRNENYSSWLFTFSDDDKERIYNYYNNDHLPVFIYLLCSKKELKNSEIVVLKYDEFLKVEDNKSITIGVEKNKNSFYLFLPISRSKDDAIQIQRNRIEKTFDELINEVIKEKPRLYRQKQMKRDKMTFESLIFNELLIYSQSSNCPICDHKLETCTISNEKDKIIARKCSGCMHIFLNKKQYKKVYEYTGGRKLIADLSIMDFEDEQLELEDNVNPKGEFEKIKLKDTKTDTIYFMNKESTKCPIHNSKMDVKLMNFGKKIKDTIYFCRQCNKHIVSKSHMDYLLRQSKNCYELKKIKYIELEHI
ncbi:hypothetical protein GCM10023142_16130 [Anaerocolumna aminovalerica]|uniref:Uncharacterized protein n=1 Tax=Anaerocolumna aminovalerica TaxID=1527 RepID=A0A1I5C314_9FIRM|nr:hypothetical protein [Anaerocolumna aminovalerica]SFN81317.1 hypothetical protein SAMN04489757_10295 [Anaerocolumna aminovalerica]